MKKFVSKKQLREFGLLIGLGFPLFLGFLLPLLSGHPFRSWTLYIGIPFLLLGIFKPNFLSYLYEGWMKLGLALGWINSKLIFGLIFIIIVQPISIIMKFFGYDPLRKKFSPEKSYRELKNQKEIDLTRIF